MLATPNGSHEVAVQRRAARPANRKARPVAVAVALAAEAQVAVKVAPTPAARELAVAQVAAVASAELITAARAASNAHRAARPAPSRPLARQAPAHERAVQRDGSRRTAAIGEFR